MESTTIKLNMKQWAAEDQPNNKLMQMGTQCLSDAELLAILVGSGTPQKNAVEVARSILAAFDNNLATLSKANFSLLNSMEGVGNKTICKIMAAFELGKRRQIAAMGTAPVLSSATSVYNFMRPKMQDLEVEEFHVCLMNQSCKLLKWVKISTGGITETMVDVRLILKQALLCNAVCLTAVHNHPSGNVNPSRFDDTLTQNIKKACDIMRIRLLDHVIVADGNYYSYAEMGRL